MRLPLLICCAAAIVAAPAALADGLPVLGVDVGPEGVAADAVRYVTVPSGHGTVLAATATHGGAILRWRVLPGSLTIPAVAYDGSASGLSADGKTLVLIQPRVAFPRARTKLVVLGTRHFTIHRTIRLDGDYSFDAISPRGRLIYLIHYQSVVDPNRYEVRAYDLRHARLLPKPVTVPGEQMHGRPLTRATSRDGRFAYTLYDSGDVPFVHALDTSTVSAKCYDLDQLKGVDTANLRLRLGAARTLVVGNGLRPLLTVTLTEP
jgi:hypothetical protein